MSKVMQHYGWWVSPYSAKTRSYLRFKQFPFEDITPSGFRLKLSIERNVGRAIMPTVRLPDGTWLQDSSDIIDTLEGLHPEPTIVPPGPTQRLVSHLAELHGDEWLCMCALHYRWHIPENADFAMAEFARSGLPGLPVWIGKRLVAPAARKMQSYLPALGVREATIPGLERFTEQLISDLERHFSEHAFLLGGRPCLGDFAFFGPLWAHLFRDPGSRFLFREAPKVQAWMERLRTPSSAAGSFLPNDEVPATLTPIFRRMFADQMVWVETLRTAIDDWCAAHPDATRVPRALGVAPFHIGSCGGERKLATFTQWKAQRPWSTYQNASGQEQTTMAAWIEEISANNPFETPIRNPFVRRHFKTVLAKSPGSPGVAENE